MAEESTRRLRTKRDQPGRFGDVVKSECTTSKTIRGAEQLPTLRELYSLPFSFLRSPILLMEGHKDCSTNASVRNSVRVRSFRGEERERD